MAFKPYELKDSVFEAADRLALQDGLDAVSVDRVFKETGGSRDRVRIYVAEWKTIQAAEAAHTPASLRATAKRMAEEAFVLATIELKHSGSASGPAPARRREPSPQRTVSAPGRDYAPAKPTSPKTQAPRSFAELPRPRGAKQSSAPASREAPPETRSARRLTRKDWAEANDPDFARAIVTSLRAVGHPLWAAELKARLPRPFAKITDYDPHHPSRTFDRRLVGSAVYRTKTNMYWLRGRPEPPRPRRPKYTRLDTPLARRRRRHQHHVGRAVAIIRDREEIRFSALWNVLSPPQGYRKEWLRHALRAIVLRPGSPISVENGIYRWRISSRPR